MTLKLYHYWRSSASWRVRWAFALKGISYESIPIDLLKGEQKSEAHLKRNPNGSVPVLEIIEKGKSKFLSESIAIMEWAEELFPKPSLLSGDAFLRGRVRQLSELINADVHPVQNLRVRQLVSEDEEKRKDWSRHWIRRGFNAYENVVKETAGKFSVGDQVTMADLCLIPQCYNAKRFDIALKEFPFVARIYDAAMETEACKASAPEKSQP